MFRLFISAGDPNGIAPEIAMPAVQHLAKDHQVILCVPENLTGLYSWPETPFLSDKTLDPGFYYLPSETTFFSHQPGTFSEPAGVVAFHSFVKAVQAVRSDRQAALLTLPINKKSFSAAGSPFNGHTEFLGHLLNEQEPLMILLNEQMRVALLTVHVPIHTVSEKITSQRITDRILLFQHSLKSDFGIVNPRIALLGLNPHAGEDGTIGTEEEETFIPAINHRKDQGIQVEGPFPSDGFFGSRQYRDFDGIMAAYHDQGLIPLKLSGMDSGVNFSAGSSIVRTSPDHGTAYNIAGKGIADPSSCRHAANLAFQILQNRQID